MPATASAPPSTPERRHRREREVADGSLSIRAEARGTGAGDALETIIRDAQRFSDRAQTVGSRNQNGYYMIGVVGVAAGFLAGIASTDPSWHVISGVAGVVAGLVAAVQTFLKRREKSRFQYDNAARAGQVALDGRILADREQPPTEAELLALAARLTDIRLRRFE